VKQDFRHFRTTNDDSYFIWRSGGHHLSIFDVVSGTENEKIRGFWKTPLETRPIGAACSPDANKIVGVSVQGKDDPTIHYYERKGEDVTLYNEIFKKFVDQSSRSV
jgi:hypothetical protein